MNDMGSPLSRRQFLKAGAGLGGALALGMSLRPIASHAQTLKVAGAKEYASICPYCAVGCGTLISVPHPTAQYGQMLAYSLAPATLSVWAWLAIGRRLMPSASAPPRPAPAFRNWRRLSGEPMSFMPRLLH